MELNLLYLSFKSAKNLILNTINTHGVQQNLAVYFRQKSTQLCTVLIRREFSYILHSESPISS